MASSVATSNNAPRGRCKAHPAQVADRICAECGLVGCSACTVPKQYGQTRIEVCGKCGGLIRMYNPVLAAQAVGDTRTVRELQPLFYLRVGDLFSFAFTSVAGPISIVCYALIGGTIIFFARTAPSPLPFIGWAIVNGLILSYLAFIIRRVDLGDDEVSPPTDFDGISEDIVEPLLRYAAAMLPIVVACVWILYSGEYDFWKALGANPGALVLLVYGLLALPGGIAQASLHAPFLDLINPVKQLSVLWHHPGGAFAAIAYTVGLSAVKVFLTAQLWRLPTFLGDCLGVALHVYVGLVLSRMYGLMLRELR
jgi:hypothetical protein